MITTEDIKCCIRKGVENCNDYDVIMRGSTNYGEGFVCDIRYAAMINRKTGKETELVVKYLKHTVSWKGTPVMTMFQREVFIYTKVYPIFRSLQRAICEKLIFKGLVECYGCSLQDGKEIIVLDNLKSSGYNIRPRQKPYSIEESKLVLTELAKWHALSFVLKDQKPDLFEELSEYKVNIFGQLSIDSNLYQLFYDEYINSINMIKGYVDDKVFEVYQKLKDKFSDLMLGHIGENSRYMVISHGDAWSNNFLFKCTNSEDTNPTPTDVYIIDWQCASLALPVYDVSHFLYTSSNVQQLNKMDELLETYYDTLSDSIKQLKADPDILYPRRVFQEQYKKYSGRGLIMTPLFLTYLLSDNIEEPDKSENVRSLKQMFRDFEPSDKEEYRRRLIEFAEHYARSQY